MIKVGRGIGAGLILKDQLFGGDGEAAGEIGHVVVDPDGDACHCGRFGCLETVASAPAIIRRSGARSLEDLATRAAAGDDQALGLGPSRRTGARWRDRLSRRRPRYPPHHRWSGP